MRNGETQADIARTYGVDATTIGRGGLGGCYSILSANSTISANSNATAKIIGMASSIVNHSAVC
jgi:hypothetical protein